MKQIHSRILIVGGLICTSVTSCAPSSSDQKLIPSLEYARTLGAGERQDIQRARAMGGLPVASTPSRTSMASRAPNGTFRQVAQTGSDTPRYRYAAEGGVAAELPKNDPNNTVTNMAPDGGNDPGYEIYESTAPNIRDYNGPLSLGDPGVSASLWQESRGETNLFHDFRAWQPMDLITILVTERSQGKKAADTDVKTESTFQAALENFFGYEKDIEKRNSDKDGNPKVDLSNLINASTATEFKGEGETTRSDTLTAQISAMVVEVLPGGLLRVEGERIISMNNEEQIMIISGLARTRDITSDNQIDSSKIANLRIDYFGRGAIGSAQYGGWFGNLLRMLWPF